MLSHAGDLEVWANPSLSRVEISGGTEGVGGSLVRVLCVRALEAAM